MEIITLSKNMIEDLGHWSYNLCPRNCYMLQYELMESAAIQ